MKPIVNSNPGANYYSSAEERIVEFSDAETDSGGLISFRRVNGELLVSLYRLDENVRVVVERGHQDGAVA